MSILTKRIYLSTVRNTNKSKIKLPPLISSVGLCAVSAHGGGGGEEKATCCEELLHQGLTLTHREGVPVT